MKKLKIILPFIIILAMSAAVFYTFYRNVHLLGGLNVKFDRTQIEQRAKLLIRVLEIDTKNLEINAELKSNTPLIRQVQEEYGFKKGNQLLRNSLPGYYWKIAWAKSNDRHIVVGNESDNRNSNNSNRLTVEYDNNGNLIEFNRAVTDSVRLPSLDLQQARILVKKFISRFGTIQNLADSADTLKPSGYSFLSGANELLNFKIERKIQLPYRTDYQYTWTGQSSYIDDKIEMEATVSGNIISNLKFTYQVPESYTEDNTSIYQGALTALFDILMIILIGVFAYKKIKAYEIGFKLAFIMGIAVAVSQALYEYIQITVNIGWLILIPMVGGPLIFGGALFITWAVSETTIREHWKDKMNSLDMFANGYFFHSKTGEAVYNGISAGLALTVIWLVLLFFIQQATSIWSVSYDTLLLSNLNSANPALGILFKNIYMDIFLAAVFFSFLMSALKNRITSPAALIIITGIIWGLVITNDIHPIYIGVFLEILVGISLAFIFYKFDFMTALIALISYNTITKGLALFTTGHPTYTFSGFVLIIIMIFVLAAATFAVFTKDSNVDPDDIMPAFEKNITERQRLQRELEIAKDVQLSFLPRVNPVINGLNIASRCVPAMEVGGDYYDFVTLEKERLGIIIGDVSGKGTQAAFYMTLTKGFLKALSKTITSPAEFLRQMNSLFYENVERGTFISMIYATVDTGKKVLTLARAGHNPVIFSDASSGETKLLYPPGMALGLESGNIFNKTIEETVIAFDSGDVIAFYTDGFTEAMNKTKEEFGEEKLINSISRNSRLSADEILDKVIGEVKSFIGKAEQHDDMTMVIIKIS